MSVTEQIDQFIAQNGGNTRDALNVALARLRFTEKRLNDIKNRESAAPELVEAIKGLAMVIVAERESQGVSSYWEQEHNDEAIRRYAAENWQEGLTTSARAALRKAGIDNEK